MSRQRVTEIIVETVALRTVADVAVEQVTVGLAVNKVSLVKACLLNLAEGVLDETGTISRSLY